MCWVGRPLTPAIDASLADSIVASIQEFKSTETFQIGTQFWQTSCHAVDDLIEVQDTLLPVAAPVLQANKKGKCVNP